MLKRSLYKKYLLINILVVCLFAAIGVFSTQFIMQQIMEANRNSNSFEPPHPHEMRPFLKGMNRQQAIEHLRRIFDDHIWLIDANGDLLQSFTDAPIDISLTLTHLPTKLYESKLIRAPGRHHEMIAFKIAPAEYVLAQLDNRHRPPPPRRHLKITLVILVNIIISTFLGVLVTHFILFHFLRKKAFIADSIIQRLRQGDLKARFPITKADEIGQAMTKFNEMADEIEHLVSQLRNTETVRVRLLQQLAHDLRTPVASLKNMLETMTEKYDSLSEEIKQEFLTLSLSEVNYFSRLIEDLLFLAQVSEPKYKTTVEKVNITRLLGTVAQLNQIHQLAINLPQEEIYVLGDSHLITRLFKNALNNALSFAKSQINIYYQTEPSHELIKIIIEDDGPGLSNEALLEFGQRKVSRSFSQQTKGRISIGLGAIIMKTIADLHQGSLAIENIRDKDRTGARLTICLKTIKA